MQGPHLRKYGTQTTIDFTLYKLDGTGLKTDAAHATGDVKIMKNEGDEANTANGFTDEGQGYSIVLTAAEMEAARVVLYVVDQSSPQVWLDTTIVIDTYGNASAQHPFDLGTASAAQTGDSYARIGAPAGASIAADIAAIEAQTDDIGAAGAGLTAVPWNAAWDAEVQSEAQDAITASGLATAAELAKVPKSDGTVSWNATALAAINAEVDTALNTAIPDSPTANSINERVATMDGLILGTIAAGTHNPQSGDSYARIGAAGAGLTALATQYSVNLIPSAAGIVDAVWDEPMSEHITPNTAGTALDAVNASLSDILEDTGETLPEAIGGLVEDLASPEFFTMIADHVLRRSFASASASADGDTKTFRSLLGAVAKLVNRIAASGDTLTVYEADDATALGTQTLTTNESAAPITELNTN
jgi:hypothetical protein